MNIIVISDTHIPKRAKKLPTFLIQDLQNADLIIHSGDWNDMSVYRELQQYAPVKGVHGNTDDVEIKEVFPDKLLIEIANVTIGVVHGHGQKGTTEKRVITAFKEEKVDLVIFGHSHIPCSKKLDNGCILFNPGSATDKRKQAQYSYGKIKIERTLEIEHVFYVNKT
ncbi:metallophosphoesterase family protein [Halalkalibacter urbisdiaboli]|uniref:metallophosphoesterase family protein n=1 Tax=Halalkalibacter urbisdiaboli TaxID=1960589 RepID=UPI000B432B21|nr:metallophosphoesterase [Halalkalibacter urbisdiaboli]